jgi:hypothetical protein
LRGFMLGAAAAALFVEALGASAAISVSCSLEAPYCS